jgi:Capsular polysaccharide synthesis protein
MKYNYQEFKTVYNTLLIFLIIVFSILLTKHLYARLTNNIIINDGLIGSHMTYGSHQSSAIPNRIWTFWNGPMNLVVEKCIDSWRHYNPTYEIVVLNKDNLSQYCPVDIGSIKFANEFDARYSDYVRVSTLAKHGGIWIDASCICHQSFDWIHGIQRATGCEMVGYYINTNTIHLNMSPVVENWFFACIPNSRFVIDWRDEFMRMSEFNSVDDYVENVISGGIDLQNIDSYNYLAMHVAAQNILQRFKWTFSTCYSLYLLKAENAPFLYLSNNNWDVGKGVDNLKSSTTYSQYYKSPFIKLRGGDRNYLLNNIDGIDNVFSHIKV